MVCYMQHEGLSLLFVFAFSRNHLYNWYKLVDGRLFVCLFCFLYLDPVGEWVQEWTELKHLAEILLCSMGKAFVWYFEALIINAWSAISGTSNSFLASVS